uniref:Mythl transferase n=1 Tax=Phyllosticta capitalensis polymycovirus 1 TaxID=3367395 RepID=A0AB74UL83_9VIRU
MRRHAVTSPPRRPMIPIREGEQLSSPPSRQGSTHTPSNLVSPTRSRTSVSRSYRAPEGYEVVLPFTLFEYGFPGAPVDTPLPDDSQFTDAAGGAFMRSEAGKQLRRNEWEYARMTRQFMVRSAQFAGARVCFLGCGASKEMLSLLRRGVESAVMVDVSEPALARLERSIDEAGLSAQVEVEYVKMDAGEFVASVEEPEFDIVVATKCMGLVLATTRACGNFVDFSDLVADTLRDGGSFFVDHHVAFSCFAEDVRVVDVCPPNLVSLATIGGRYADDVCYNASLAHSEFSTVASICSAQSEHNVQTWQFFHHRLSPERKQSKLQRIGPNRSVAPVPFTAVRASEFDSSADVMFPVNARGIKRIPDVRDVRAHRITDTFVKYDGVPGVLMMEGNDMVFMSSIFRFARELSREVSVPMVLTAELVQPTPQSMVLVATGVININGVQADPLDFSALAGLVPVLNLLAPDGIVATLPEHVRLLDGDEVVFESARGRQVRLPVDGVQLTIGGRNGVFVKPAPFCTIDAVPAEAAGVIEGAYLAANVQDTPSIVGAVGTGAWEFVRTPGTHEWTRGRRRNDKTFSDGLGSAAHTVAMSLQVQDLGMATTCQQVLERMTK